MNKDVSNMDLEYSMRSWDLTRWQSYFKIPRAAGRKMAECMGWRISASSAPRGHFKFDNQRYHTLMEALMQLSKKLPKKRNALLHVAMKPITMTEELEVLLATHGLAIWGKGADRSCLLTPDPKTNYKMDLFYEDLEHRAM